MMEATKLLLQREGEGNQQLPYEDLPGGVENISRENKVVQVYSNKCHCQKCEDKYKLVTTVNRTAVVDTIEGKIENINVMFCKGCGQYFVSIVTLDQYKTIYGGLLIECSGLLDCLWGELYGSINMAEISDGIITPEHADYLRKRYLYGAGE